MRDASQRNGTHEAFEFVESEALEGDKRRCRRERGGDKRRRETPSSSVESEALEAGPLGPAGGGGGVWGG